MAILRYCTIMHRAGKKTGPLHRYKLHFSDSD